MWQLLLAIVRPIFGFLFGWFRSALPWIAGFFGSTVTQILIGIGVTVTSFSGFNTLTDLVLDVAASGFDGLPADISMLLGLMWVDKAFNMIASAGVLLLTIKGLKAGTVSRGVWHKPGSNNGGIDF